MWDTFSDADSVDVAGVRKDGGLDLVISAEAPIDADVHTLELLQQKVRNYLAAADRLRSDYGLAPSAPVSIYIACPYSIAPEAQELIKLLQVIAAGENVPLEVRERMDD